ncbi:MAG: DUF3108 domain-containing protein [Candidatus Omnitrophota bacterium]
MISNRIRSLYILVFIVFISGCGIIGQYKIVRPTEEIKIAHPLKGFNVGERFTYKAEWLGMDVAEATLSVEGIENMNGRKAYRIVGTAATTPILSKLYKVEDKITTYVDVEYLYPLKYEKIQREGGYRSDEYIDFDHKKGKASYFSRLNKGRKEYNIPSGVLDPLSSLYYFRLQEAKVGTSVFANVNADEKNYLLDARVIKKGVLTIKNVGEWDAFMVEPLPWFGGKVERKAKATIWFSTDDRRIPLLMHIKSIPLVGTVVISLKKIEQLDTKSN